MVVWVGLEHDTLPKNHGMKYEIEERPQELFKKLLVHYGFNKSTNENVQTFMSDLGNLWPKPKPNTTPNFVPFLYCELQLIGYLDRHNISVHMNLISISKLMCWGHAMPMSMKSTIAGKMTVLMCCPGPLARHIMHG